MRFDVTFFRWGRCILLRIAFNTKFIVDMLVTAPLMRLMVMPVLPSAFCTLALRLAFVPVFVLALRPSAFWRCRFFQWDRRPCGRIGFGGKYTMAALPLVLLLRPYSLHTLRVHPAFTFNDRSGTVILAVPTFHSRGVMRMVCVSLSRFAVVHLCSGDRSGGV